MEDNQSLPVSRIPSLRGPQVSRYVCQRLVSSDKLGIAELLLFPTPNNLPPTPPTPPSLPNTLPAPHRPPPPTHLPPSLVQRTHPDSPWASVLNEPLLRAQCSTPELKSSYTPTKPLLQSLDAPIKPPSPPLTIPPKSGLRSLSANPSVRDLPPPPPPPQKPLPPTPAIDIIPPIPEVRPKTSAGERTSHHSQPAQPPQLAPIPRFSRLDFSRPRTPTPQQGSPDLEDIQALPPIPPAPSKPPEAIPARKPSQSKLFSPKSPFKHKNTISHPDSRNFDPTLILPASDTRTSASADMLEYESEPQSQNNVSLDSRVEVRGITNKHRQDDGTMFPAQRVVE